jgi:hypothetical protein
VPTLRESDDERAVAGAATAVHRAHDAATDSEEKFDQLWRRTNLTAGQLLTWLSQKHYPAAPAHRTAVLWIIPVGIDRERIERAFQAVVDRSDALRIVVEDFQAYPGNGS